MLFRSSKVTNLHIKDIVNNQYVVGWDDLYNSTGYKVGVITSWDKFLLAASKQIPGSRNYELIEDADIETNYYKVKKSCFNKRKTIDVPDTKDADILNTKCGISNPARRNIPDDPCLSKLGALYRVCPQAGRQF